MLTSGLILDVDPQAVFGVTQSNQQVVPRVHEQILFRVGGEGSQGRVDRIGWCLCTAILCDEGKIDILQTGDGLAGGIQECAIDWIP